MVGVCELYGHCHLLLTMTSKDVTNDFCASSVVLSSSCDNIYHHLYDLFAFFSLFDFFQFFFHSGACVNLKFVSSQDSREERKEKLLVTESKPKVKLFLSLFSSHFPFVLGYIAMV